ncbi:MAG: dihydroorotate dehydrogenase B catalytic subunit [Euryarchaeota archaeon RBG_19FT_COMBO_56_21]|nr:MAG: dihydroorotate dehydrogenase B catalytic subunit [Euryarchaeota archaeon RBG_19FT_COMBO_56_21]
MTNLAVDICGLRMKNPTMLASGVLDETGKSMLMVAKAGAGAIVTKSIGKEPRVGHSGPTIVELPQALLNAMGLPNPGIEAYAAEIAEARAGEIPIIGSVFGGSEEEIAELAKAMQGVGVAAVELNLSCPHAKGYGAEIGSTPEMVEAICRSVKETVTIPVFAKLTPNTSSIASLAKAAEKGGADAVVAINTLKGMVISPEAKMPVLGNRYGGLSGPAIRPIGVRCVYEIYEAVNIPVIGVGGISTGREAVEYIMAGARAVQIGTAIWREGPEVFSKICREIMDFMDEYGYSKVSEMTGVAHHGRT